MTPHELLATLIEEVGLFAGSAARQEEWAHSKKVPAEEIALQFYDAMDTWIVDPLRQDGFLDPSDGDALDELRGYVAEVQPCLFEGSGVTDAPEWQRVEELAARVVQLLRRHVPVDDA